MSSTRGSSGAFHTFHDRIPSTSTYSHDYSGESKYGVDDSDLPPQDQAIRSIEEPSNLLHDREFSNETILRIDDRPHRHASSQFGSPRRASHLSSSIISELPDDVASIDDPPAPFTPIKDRPIFRNPSSVRAMQMASPPPFEHFSSPRSSQRYKLSTPSRSGTPRSVRSQSAIKPKLSPKPLRKEHPLVLLHVTLLPAALPYSLESMQAILPPSILENYNLLRDKASDTVLQRGILIPHPREDYELLEERLLEALELKTPRILKCGHYHLSCARSSSGAGPKDRDTLDSGYEDAGSSASSHSRQSSSSQVLRPLADADAEDIDPEERCTDCGGRIKEPRFGIGEGKSRFEMSIYASNGLMRAGAWAAAWKEMERVDVEIGVWMPEGMRREMDEWRAKEEDEIRKRVLEEEERMRGEQNDQYLGRSASRVMSSTGAGVRDAEPDGAVEEAKRMFEHHMEAAREQSTPQGTTSKSRNQRQVPLATLLQNYIYLLAQDRRNIAIFLLAMLALSLFLNKGSPLPPSLSSTPSLLGNPTSEFSKSDTQTALEARTSTNSQTGLPSWPVPSVSSVSPLSTAASILGNGWPSQRDPPSSVDEGILSEQEEERVNSDDEQDGGVLSSILPDASSLLAAVVPDTGVGVELEVGKEEVA